jgi:hypothetical protein
LNTPRALAALGALAGLTGLVLQYVLMMGAAGASPIEATSRFLAYFTILTNVFVSLVFARAALRPGVDTALNTPRFELMALTAILFVCAVYNILLAPRWEPQGWQLAADILLHQTTPVLFALYWLSRPHGRLSWRDALFAALWPVAYAAYGLTRGALDGFYPYFFMDLSAASIGQVALNLAGLTAAFVTGALLLVGADSVLSRGAARSA